MLRSSTRIGPPTGPWCIFCIRLAWRAVGIELRLTEFGCDLGVLASFALHTSWSPAAHSSSAYTLASIFFRGCIVVLIQFRVRPIGLCPPATGS